MALEELCNDLIELVESNVRNIALLAAFASVGGSATRGVMDRLDLPAITAQANDNVRSEDGCFFVVCSLCLTRSTLRVQDDSALVSTCLKASFGVAVIDASQASSSEHIAKVIFFQLAPYRYSRTLASVLTPSTKQARNSRDAFISILQLALRSEVDDCNLLAVGLMHEARMFYSPATPSLCWVPNSDMLELADKLMTKVCSFSCHIACISQLTRAPLFFFFATGVWRHRQGRRTSGRVVRHAPTSGLIVLSWIFAFKKNSLLQTRTQLAYRVYVSWLCCQHAAQLFLPAAAKMCRAWHEFLDL